MPNKQVTKKSQDEQAELDLNQKPDTDVQSDNKKLLMLIKN